MGEYSTSVPADASKMRRRESNTFGMELELTEGTRFDKGNISPYFMTDTERMEAVLDDPYILITDSKISAHGSAGLAGPDLPGHTHQRARRADGITRRVVARSGLRRPVTPVKPIACALRPTPFRFLPSRSKKRKGQRGRRNT